MALSKRLRFEVLRRDNHQCRYCGASSPDTKLTVDHVVPTALGGSDEPNNLVTACRECNAGKSASSPDAPIVADVKSDALRWARAIEVVSNARMNDRVIRDSYVQRFEDAWKQWTYPTYRHADAPSPDDIDKWNQSVGDLAKFVTPVAIIDRTLYVRAKSTKRTQEARQRAGELLSRFDDYAERFDELAVLDPYKSAPTITLRHELPRPPGWKASLWSFYAVGLPIEEVEDAVYIACSAQKVSVEHTFRYFCGVCWRKIEEIREAASDVVTTLEEA